MCMCSTVCYCREKEWLGSLLDGLQMSQRVIDTNSTANDEDHLTHYYPTLWSWFRFIQGSGSGLQPTGCVRSVFFCEMLMQHQSCCPDIAKRWLMKKWNHFFENLQVALSRGSTQGWGLFLGESMQFLHHCHWLHVSQGPAVWCHAVCFDIMQFSNGKWIASRH